MNKGGLGTKPSGRIVPKPRGAGAATSTATATAAPRAATTTSTAKRTTTTKSTTMKENRVTPRTNSSSVKPASPVVKKKVSSSSTSAATTAEINSLKASNEEATRALSELRLEMDGLEKERDFYFEKLRDVEIMLQDLEDKGEGTPLSTQIFKILYATAEGFEQVEEEATTTADLPPAPIPIPREDVAVVQPPVVPEDYVEDTEDISEPVPIVASMAVEQETY